MAEFTREQARAELRRRAQEELRRRQAAAQPTIGQQRGIAPVTPKQVAQQAAAQQGPFEAFGTAARRGFGQVAGALGAPTPTGQLQEQAFRALEEQRPIITTAGEITGQAIPFLAPGAAVGAIPGLAARAAVGAGLGAAEGGVLAKATGQDPITGGGLGAVLAGGLELVSPTLSRIGGALFRRVTKRAPKGSLVTPQGRPTPEFQKALNDSGISFEELSEEAVSQAAGRPAGTVPEQAARQARFTEVGIPATRGDITQEFEQQAIEARLLESASDPSADPIRAFRLRQSEAIRSELDALVERSGVSENLGTAVKNALTSRKTLLRNRKNALYRKAGQEADRLGGIPIFTDSIESAIPDRRTVGRLSRIQGGQVDATLDLLAEFGIDQSDDAIERITAKGIDVDPLSLQNFDDFRSALNQIERADQTGATSVLIGPVREALDHEADILVENLAKAGVDDTVLRPLKKARETVRQIKTEFSPQAISGRLIDAKRDGVTPIIEASRVFKETVGPNKPIELLQRTIGSLKKAGAKGKQALGDLQAATIMDLMESAFKAQTRKIEGVKTFGGTAFNNRLTQIGDDKLKLIFQSKPEIFRNLKRVSKIAEEITPPSGAIPKGSASVILDLMNRLGVMTIMGKVPGGGIIAEGLTSLTKKAGNRRAVQQAIDAKPQTRRIAGLIESEMPTFAQAIGIAGVIGAMEEQP